MAIYRIIMLVHGKKLKTANLFPHVGPIWVFQDLGGLQVRIQICGGAVVYWSEPLTLDQRVAGSIPVNAWHFCPSARHFIHIAALYPVV